MEVKEKKIDSDPESKSKYNLELVRIEGDGRETWR